MKVKAYIQNDGIYIPDIANCISDDKNAIEIQIHISEESRDDSKSINALITKNKHQNNSQTKQSNLKNDYVGSLKGVGKTIADLTLPLMEEWELD